MLKALNEEQIQIARELRRKGYTKRQLALYFNVGSTTIWENVYKKIRKVNRSHGSCIDCGILLTKDLPPIHKSVPNRRYIPSNWKIGKHCLSCYLIKKGYNYIDFRNLLCK